MKYQTLRVLVSPLSSRLFSLCMSMAVRQMNCSDNLAKLHGWKQEGKVSLVNLTTQLSDSKLSDYGPIQNIQQLLIKIVLSSEAIQ